MGNRLPKVKINISIYFLIYIVFIFFVGKILYLVNYLMVLFVHEYAHALVAYKLGYKLTNIKLSPFGVCLNINNKLEKIDSIKIALAGPLVNIIISICILAMWWVVPEVYFFSYSLLEANLVTAVFNLLPCYPLDGSRIIGAMLNKHKKRLIVFFNIAISVGFLIFFFLTNNLSLLFMALFLITSIFGIENAPSYDYLLCEKKTVVKPIQTKTYVVDGEVCMFKLYSLITSSVYTNFCVMNDGKQIGLINENQLYEYSNKFSPTSKLKDVLK